MNSVSINIVGSGLGRRLATTDAICGLVATAVAAAPNFALNTDYKLTSVDDALALGITPLYDAASQSFLYEHIKEFFRVNPNGTLWLYCMTVATTMTDLIGSTTNSAILKLQAAAEGAIQYFGVVKNNLTIVPTSLSAASIVTPAQAIADKLFALNQPASIILGWNNFTIAGLENIRGLGSKNVSVIVGSHTGIASTEYTAVGTALGAISLAKVNENIGWVGKFNLLGGNLLTPTIDTVAVKAISDTDLDAVNAAGFIFMMNHTGVSGIFFNDSHTATDVTGDFAYIENTRVINKATRLIRQALLPYLNAPIEVNPSTGKIAAEVVKAIESAGRKLIEEEMLRNTELSGFTFLIDEQQDILSTSELVCQLSLVPTGTARTITINLGFSNPFNS